MEITPKVQINGQVRTDSMGKIVERSTLLNIRTDDVSEAIQLFSQLRLKMDSQGVATPTAERAVLPVSNMSLPKEVEQACPECGNSLIERGGRNGSFYGCKSYPGCRYTKRIYSN